MPAYDTSTPTAKRTYIGVDFSVPMPFTEGHALTGPEAKWVNATLATVVGNAYAGSVRRAVVTLNHSAIKAAFGDKAAAAYAADNKVVPKGYVAKTAADLQDWDHAARFAETFASYELGVSNRGSGGSATSSDPIGSMVNTLATAELKRRILAKGLKVRTLQTTKGVDGSTSKFDELKAALIARDGDALRAQAEATLASLAASDADTDDLLAGLDTSMETPAQPLAAE